MTHSHKTQVISNYSNSSSHIPPILKIMFAGAAMLLITACSILDIVNSLSSKNGSIAHADIAFGEDPRHKLDLYLPERPAENAKWIVFFYGGGWVNGHRSDYEFVGRRLAALGHYVIIPDYRLYPQVTFPAFVDDGANAVKWLFEYRQKWAEKELPVVLMGHSAGAQIAALIALNAEFLDGKISDSEQLAGWIGLAGPYNFLPLKSAVLKKVFPKSVRQASQAINFVSARNPAALILHGETDNRVLPENSLSLHHALKSNGVNAEIRIYPETGHAAIMRPFASFAGSSITVLEDINRFLKRL